CDVPESAQAALRGLKGGNLSVSVEFASVGQPQHIAAPASAKPLSDLTKQLGGLGGALGGATGGIGGTGGTGGAGGSSGGSTSAGEDQEDAPGPDKAKPNERARGPGLAPLPDARRPPPGGRDA